MKNSFFTEFRAIFFKEFKEFFSAKFAWIFLIIFSFLQGFVVFHFGKIFENNIANIEILFIYNSYLYVFFLPLLSMNIWQKEKSTQSLEILLTLGLKKSALVLAKFAFLTCILLLLLLLSLPIFFSFLYLGNLQIPLALSGYLGIFLLGLSYLAIGQFASFVARSQASAFVISLAIILLFSATGLDEIRYFLTLDANFYTHNFLEFSLSQNFLHIVKGYLKLADVIFFISFITIFLLLNNLTLNYDRFKNAK